MDTIFCEVPAAPLPVGGGDTAGLSIPWLCFVMLSHVCLGFACFWILYKWNHTMFILWLAFPLSIVPEIYPNECMQLYCIPFAVDQFIFPYRPTGHFIHLCVGSPKIYSWSLLFHLDFRISLSSSTSKNPFEIVNETHWVYRSVLGKSISTWNWIY